MGRIAEKALRELIGEHITQPISAWIYADEYMVTVEKYESKNMNPR